MKSMTRGQILILASMLVATSQPLLAQNIVSSDKYYDERRRGSTSVVALDDDLFGDSINLKDGSLEFNQDDVVIPANSGLRVTFGRQTPRHPQGLDRANMPMGAGWEINAPYMVGRYDNRRGWDARGSNLRCSSPSLYPSEWVGPSPDYNTRVIPASLFWSGIGINIPGSGFENLLMLAADQPRPQDGLNYIGSTRGHWRIGCLPGLKNSAGEGFVVRMPNGDKYTFDWMATRNAPDVLANEYYKDDNGDGTAPPYLLVPLSDVFIYATKVEDSAGNTVVYDYDPANPHQLRRIESSDGARIDIGYTNGKVSTVSSGGRTWTYTYITNYYGQVLSEVKLPDQSTWTFGGDTMWWQMRPLGMPGGFYMNACEQNPNGYRQSDPESSGVVNSVTFKHPSGAVGVFRMRALVHGSDNTPGGCGIIGTSSSNFTFGAYGEPNAYVAHSLTSKTITGVGGVSYAWSYSYVPAWSFTNACPQGCYSYTTMTDPAGVQTLYTFGNSYTDNFGELTSESVIADGVVKSTTSYSRKSSTGDFPESYGTRLGVGNPFPFRMRPVQRVERVIDGTHFVQSIESFDSFARPLRVTESSNN